MVVRENEILIDFLLVSVVISEEAKEMALIYFLAEWWRILNLNLRVSVLQSDLLTPQGYMADADGKTTGSTNSLPARRNSASEDSHSLSTSGSGDTPHPQQVSAPGTPANQHNVYQ